MRYNNLWKMMVEICKFLIKINSRIKALDERVKALDVRIKAVESKVSLPPGSDSANDEDMEAEIQAIQDSISARIE
jgi:hypothetical protein